MVKKQKSVPPVTEETTVQSEAPAAPAPAEVAAEAPKTSYDLFVKIAEGIPEDKVQLAESAGIPVRGLFQLIGTMALEIKAMQENLPVVAKTAMKETIEEYNAEAQKKYAEYLKENPQAARQRDSGIEGGIQLGLQIAKEVLGGGGGGMDEDMKKLYMESLKSNIDFTKAIQTAVVTKIAGKAITDVV